MPDYVYDLPRLLWLREAEQRLLGQAAPALLPLTMPPALGGRLAVLAGSFNPLTIGHEALVESALRDGASTALLLLPLRAIDKEGVTRAAAHDRALVMLEWAARHERVGVALVNRGLYVEQAALLHERFPMSEIVFVVGYDKIVQIFDPRYYADRDAALHALFNLASLRVAPRLGEGEAALRALLSAPENLPFAGGVAPLPLAADVDALSSTVVREAIRKGAAWESLVPAEAALFTREARPYSTPISLARGEAVDAYALRLALIEAAASGRLQASPDDFAALCWTARADSAEGRRLRAWLTEAESLPR